MRGTKALLAVAAPIAAVALFSSAARGDSGSPASAFGPASDPPASGWQIGYYTPSPHGTLSYAQAKGGSQPTLSFTSEDNTALLITGQKTKFPSLLGDLRGDASITASFTISDAGVFTYFGEPSCAGPPPDLGPLPNVRFYFQTNNAGGFDETHYWWSNPVSQVLANGQWTLNDDFSGSRWSDYFGHFGDDPMYAAGFDKALSNVTDIGVSFGGGCFFENGVGTMNGTGMFTLNDFSVG